MKAGGRIIQNKNIFKLTESEFDCIYKKHRIIIYKSEEQVKGNPNFWTECFVSKSGVYKFKGFIKRCQIHDVIIEVLNHCNL